MIRTLYENLYELYERVNPPQNENFVINHLPACRSKPVKASFIFGTQLKTF